MRPRYYYGTMMKDSEFRAAHTELHGWIGDLTQWAATCETWLDVLEGDEIFPSVRDIDHAIHRLYGIVRETEEMVSKRIVQAL